MRSLTHVLLFGTLCAASVMQLGAQRGGLGGTPAPSSTAVGAGALNFRPSATARSTVSRATIYTPGYRGSGFRGGVNNRSREYGSRYRALPFAYWIAPYYYGPFDYGDAGPGPEPGYDSSADPNAVAAIMAQQSLAQELQRLSAQVAQLERGQQAPAPPEALEQETEPAPIPITLVLRNGQQLQVQNYAVMDQTFWDLSKQSARKIPISSIDVSASTRATEAQGGEFPSLPNP